MTSVLLQPEHEFETQDIFVNMGPQHPSTHGVLRLILEIDGETVTDVDAWLLPGFTSPSAATEA